jgi:glycosyltransferase involved in cell wall biosynthesis
MSQPTPLHSNKAKASTPEYRTTILHIASDLELGAQAREIVDLAVQTHRAGWRPLIASAGGSLVLEAERSAVRHTELPLTTKSFVRSWRNRKRLEKLIEKERPVLIHAHGYDVISLATKLSSRKGLPLLIDLTEPAQVTTRLTKILHQAAQKGAHFRAPTNFMIKHLREDFKLQTERLHHIWPGVDLQWYEAMRVTPERINQLHKVWRLPEQSTVIIMATPMATGYGHKALLEALTAFETTDIYAILIGNDKASPGTRQMIEKLVEEKGLEGKIIMPEACKDWPAACWLASMIVATNAIPRGQGPELLAAQAIGRPVIVTDCGANAELVRQNETAWIVPPDDVEALVNALREALSMSPARRIDLALQTREFVTEHFPMEVWRNKMFGLYDTMLAPPPLAVAA